MAYSAGKKCFHCKKIIKEEGETWARVTKVSQGRSVYVTKEPHWFHKSCWNTYKKKYLRGL